MSLSINLRSLELPLAKGCARKELERSVQQLIKKLLWLIKREQDSLRVRAQRQINNVSLTTYKGLNDLFITRSCLLSAVGLEKEYEREMWAVYYSSYDRRRLRKH